MFFLTLLVVARIVIWTSRMGGILRYGRYSHQTLVGFFQHQMNVKVRTGRKRLMSTDFSQSRVKLASLLHVKEASLAFLF